MTGRKRLVELLKIDAEGFRAEVKLLDEASFRDRALGLIASVPPPGPDGVRILHVVCDGCGATQTVRADNPELPAGWAGREDGEFCAACQ